MTNPDPILLNNVFIIRLDYIDSDGTTHRNQRVIPAQAVWDSGPGPKYRLHWEFGRAAKTLLQQLRTGQLP